MKLFMTFVGIFLLSGALLSQAPAKISYQAVVRDASGALVRTSTVWIRFSILSGSPSGSEVFVETHQANTNSSGVASLQIGGGTPVNGSLAAVNGSGAPYYLKQEVDPDGGTNYSVSGTTELLGLPYALHSARADAVTVEVSSIGDTLYAGSGAGVIIPGLSRSAVVVPAPAYTEGYVHCFDGGDTTEIVEVTNGLSGQTWMDRNLGASQVATAFDDAASYGDLFQWGRYAEGHQCARGSNVSAITSTLATSAGVNSGDAWYGNFITVSGSPYDWLQTQDDNLWQGVAGENNPCPAGYRLPTAAEWETELNTWNSFNYNGAMASPLKLPAAGFRDGVSGGLGDVGSGGYYWSSSVSGSEALGPYFYSDGAGLSSDGRAGGSSIRCLKDTL